MSMPFFCFSQSIKKKEVDKFSNQKRVQSEWLNLSTFGPFTVLKTNLRSVDSTIFIRLAGRGVGVVGTDDAATFLFDDKSSFKIYPTSIQSYNIGIGDSPDTYDFQYNFSIEYLKILSTKKLISIRRTYNENYADTDVKSKFSERLKKLAEIMLKELQIL